MTSTKQQDSAKPEPQKPTTIKDLDVSKSKSTDVTGGASMDPLPKTGPR